MSDLNNGDMPAMPLSGDAYEDYAAYDGSKNTSYNPQCQGLTKLEYFAAKAIPPMEMIIEAMKEHSSPFTLDDYIICAASYRIKEANEVLSQLEKSK